MTVRAPIPPFTHETAVQKVRLAEDGWNSRDPHKVSLAYTPDSWWRNRSTFVTGRSEIVELLTEKWTRELDYRLIKELWAHSDDRIAVRFAYEWHDHDGSGSAPTATRTGNSTPTDSCTPSCQHQRRSHRGVRAKVLLGSDRTTPARSSGPERVGSVMKG